MKTIDKNAISQKNEPILQLKRPLLPIDKYASREGLSKDMVEHFSKIGYVQIRKFKDKTYVVDIPVSQYSFGDADSAESSQFEVETGEPEELLEDAETTVDDTADELTLLEKPVEPIHTPELERIKIAKQPVETARKPAEINPVPQPVQTYTDTEIQLDFLAAQAQAKRSWQMGAIFSTAVLFVAVFIALWSLADRKVQLNRANQAYAGMYQLSTDSAQTIKHAQLLQNDLDISEATITHLRSDLEKSTAEVKSLQKDLIASRADVEMIRSRLEQAKQTHQAAQQKNAKALKELTEQFQNLKIRLNNSN